MSGRVTEHQTPKPMTDEQILEIEGLIQAGELYDENLLLDIVEDLIATVRETQAEMDEFAIAVGYGERPEGQSGVHRLHGEQLADRWKQIERERDEARAEVERLRGIVEVNDRRLAAVWDEAREKGGAK